MTLDHLNALGYSAFVATLAGIFEHSPWVAEAVVPQRPFDSVEALHSAMCATVAAAAPERQLALIRAHPRLASKAAIAGRLTAASSQEQAGAGLLQCSPTEYARLSELNDAYQRRFGFPFILAVRGHDRSSIIANLASRLLREAVDEQAEALRQIERIAQFRLSDLLEEREHDDHKGHEGHEGKQSQDNC